MLTIGSIDRETAAKLFPFLARNFRGRRAAIRELTHTFPEFVFWISPDGRLYDARDSHLKNPPKGFDHIVKDEPNYGGFLRGRIASLGDNQLVVVYCQESDLADASVKLQQFMSGMSQVPVPMHDEALVISDNGDIYGTVDDIRHRAATK